jgi:hypothetical protein
MGHSGQCRVKWKHLLWEQRVGGSNPSAPTNRINHLASFRTPLKADSSRWVSFPARTSVDLMNPKGHAASFKPNDLSWEVAGIMAR